MKHKDSFYKDYLVEKPGKKFLPYLLDFAMCLLLSILLFVPIDLIANQFPLYKEKKEEWTNIKADLVDYVEESNLTNYKDGAFIDNSTNTKKYIESLIEYSKSDLNSKEEPIKDDRLYLYYVDFKTMNIDSYKEKENYGIDYLMSTILDIDNNNYYDINENFYSLKPDNLEDINEYIHNPNYSKGKEIYNKIYENYFDKLTLAIKEVETSFIPYVGKYEDFNDLTNELLSLRGSSILIAYVLSTFIIYIVFPLLFKDGKTISFKVFKKAVCQRKGYKLSWYNFVLKFLMNLISGLIILLIDAFLLFGSQGMYFISTFVLGFINFAYVGVFSLVFILLSFIFTYINRVTHQNIEEFISLEVVKDAKEFVVEEKKNGTREENSY